MIALSIIVSIQAVIILWLYGKHLIHNEFIRRIAIAVNYHSSLIIDMAIQKALEDENYELASALKKQKDKL